MQAAVLDLDPAEERVLEAVQEHRHAWVAGSAGSGRTVLMRRLAKDYPSVVSLELLDVEEADSNLQVIGALASVLAPDRRARCRVSDGVLDVARVADELAKQDTLIVLRVPPSWEKGGTGSNDWVKRRVAAGRRLLASLWQSKVKVVVISDPWLPALGDLGATPIRLPVPTVDLTFLESEAWSSFSPHASALMSRARPDGLMPVPLRLAVGAVALGVELERVSRAITEFPATATPILIRMIAAALEQPRHVGARAAMERFVALRRPIGARELAGLLDVPPGTEPLFLECVGYGDPVRLPPEVRNGLRSALGAARGRSESDHARFGDHWKSKDGAISPPFGNPTTLEAWYEKMHHFAHAGELRGGEWERIAEAEESGSPELYWDRGRALSFAGKFEQAARIYRRSVERFPEDDYSWHYLAHNLRSAGVGRDECERGFRRAVDLDPMNPWWNSRLVTFLVGDARNRAAREEWRAALTRVDPDGTRSAGDSGLVEELHRWVAKSWLDAGEPREAARVFEPIPPSVLNGSSKLQLLRHAIDDALEAEELGTAVYPFEVPMDERWKDQSSLAPDVDEDGAGLVRWWPGQIVEATRERVRIVYAEPSVNPHVLLLTEVSAEEWREIGWGGAPEQARGFVELGEYANGKRIICRRPRATPPQGLEIESSSLSYLRRWTSQRPDR